jgi:hypothetical protein
MLRVGRDQICQVRLDRLQLSVIGIGSHDSKPAERLAVWSSAGTASGVLPEDLRHRVGEGGVWRCDSAGLPAAGLARPRARRPRSRAKPSTPDGGGRGESTAARLGSSQSGEPRLVTEASVMLRRGTQRSTAPPTSVSRWRAPCRGHQPGRPPIRAPAGTSRERESLPAERRVEVRQPPCLDLHLNARLWSRCGVQVSPLRNGARDRGPAYQIIRNS